MSLFNAKSVTCNICNAIFRDAYALNRHQARMHDTQRVTTQKQKLECDTCSKVFRDYYDLKRHNATVHHPNPTKQLQKPKLDCDICSKVFHNYYALKRHNVTVHQPTPTKQLKKHKNGMKYMFKSVPEFLQVKKTQYSTPY